MNWMDAVSLAIGATAGYYAVKHFRMTGSVI